MGIGYGALFLLARRPVALRLGMVGRGAAVLLLARLGLAAAGRPVATPSDQAMTLIVLALGATLGSGRRGWLVRATIDDLREQIQGAAQRICLTCEELGKGQFRLTERGGVEHLRVRRLASRLQWTVLPGTHAPGKVVLLVRWLSKQYSGPVPRVRVVLKRRGHENANGAVHGSDR